MSAAVATFPRPRLSPAATVPHRQPVPAPGSGSPLTLTRRGRLAVIAFLLVLLVATTVVLGSRSTATGERGANEATATVVVGRGDTLWEIAAQVAAPGRVREMVHRIEKLNALPGPALVEGQELAVPLN